MNAGRTRTLEWLPEIRAARVTCERCRRSFLIPEQTDVAFGHNCADFTVAELASLINAGGRLGDALHELWRTWHHDIGHEGPPADCPVERCITAKTAIAAWHRVF